MQGYPEIESAAPSWLAVALEVQLSVAGKRQPAKAAQMIGIGAAEIRAFLFLLWSTLGLAVATVALYRFHRKTAARILGGIDLGFIALTRWAYLSIWYVGSFAKAPSWSKGCILEGCPMITWLPIWERFLAFCKEQGASFRASSGHAEAFLCCSTAMLTRPLKYAPSSM